MAVRVRNKNKGFMGMDVGWEVFGVKEVGEGGRKRRDSGLFRLRRYFRRVRK